jgi:hypothetical protein
MEKLPHNLLTNLAKKSPDAFLQGFQNLVGIDLMHVKPIDAIH